jgi:DNA (cytosine-5)-methyltransferase 1
MNATIAPALVETEQKSCPRCAGVGILEATDIFCGAGGSSLGLEYVCCTECGRQLIKVTQALNHWDLAVDAHNANFPDADHDVHDVDIIPASRFRRTPILWASPECVHHAYCRGQKSDDESAERSRATMSDVVRFTAFHRYDCIIVENVVEARLWEGFDAWFDEIEALGYHGQIVYFNSQFALPTPQSRDRMYVVFSRRGLKRPDVDFKPVSWCSDCETVVHGVQTWKKPSKGSLRDKPGKYYWGRYGSQYIYTCERCGGPVAPAVCGAETIINWDYEMHRIGDKPKAAKTRERIRQGIINVGSYDPITVQVGGHLYERPGYARVWSVHEALRTVTGTPYMGLVVPGKSDTNPTPSDVPAGTITSRQHLGLLIQNMENNRGRDVAEPTPPVTGGGNHMLIQVNRGLKNGSDRRASRELGEPTRAVSGHGEMALVSFRNHGTAKSATEPAHTVCGGGLHHGLLMYNGNPGYVSGLDGPAGTVTGRDKQSLLVPFYRTGKARPTERPVGAVTGKDRHALVVTDQQIDDCLFRMLQWPELQRAQMMHIHPDGRPYLLTARRRDKRTGKMRDLSNEKCTKMIGNAVSSPVATALGHAVVDVLIAA